MMQQEAVLSFFEIAQTERLHYNAKGLWVAIFTHMVEMRKWDKVFLRTEALSEELGITKSSFHRARNALVNKNLLVCSSRPTGAYYTLRLPEGLLEIEERELY